MKKAVFFDRDGVINIDRAYVYKVEDFELVDGILEAAKYLYDAGYLLVIITNQSGIARGYYSEDDLARLNAHTKQLFDNAGAPIAQIYYCPHHPNKGLAQYVCQCDCRKPLPGLFLRAAQEFNIDMNQSIAFGDKLRDLQAAQAAGVSTRILVGRDALSIPEITSPATAVARSVLSAVKTLNII